MNGTLFLRIFYWVWVGAIGLFLLIPTIIIVPISFTSVPVVDFPPVGFSLRWYQGIIDNPAWLPAIATSFKVGLASSVLAIAAGTSAAIGLSKLGGYSKRLLQVVILSPLVTPIIALSISLYMIFAQWRLAGSFWGLVFAHTVLAIPFVVVSVAASLETLNPNLVLASEGLGASRWRTFRRVVFPLILPGVMAGAILAFITSWDEIVVALFLTSPSLRTIPVLIWTQVRADINPTIAAISTLLIAVSLAGLVIISVLRRKQ